LTKFMTTLSKVRGRLNVPLMYLVREEDPPEEWSRRRLKWFNSPYNNLDDMLVACLRHKGNAFEQDNTTLFVLLKKATEDGDCWTHIMGLDPTLQAKRRNRKVSTYADGKRAFEMLMWHSLEDTSDRNVIRSADAVLRNTIYTGDSRGHTLQNHCNQLSKAIQT